MDIPLLAFSEWPFLIRALFVQWIGRPHSLCGPLVVASWSFSVLSNLCRFIFAHCPPPYALNFFFLVFFLKFKNDKLRQAYMPSSALQRLWDASFTLWCWLVRLWQALVEGVGCYDDEASRWMLSAVWHENLLLAGGRRNRDFLCTNMWFVFFPPSSPQRSKRNAQTFGENGRSQLR